MPWIFSVSLALNNNTSNVFKCQMNCFSAKVGGWIGLVVGASAISFIEFLYFGYKLAFMAFGGLFRRKTRVATA
jgi:hypothetical protein